MLLPVDVMELLVDVMELPVDVMELEDSLDDSGVDGGWVISIRESA
jgi:hypothetical protein